MSIGDLAELVFCSNLQPSQRPSARAVRHAVLESLRRHDNALGDCAAHVASCYGNDPEETCERMRWARSVAIVSFLDQEAAA